MSSESGNILSEEGSHYASPEVVEHMEELLAWAREQKKISYNPHLPLPLLVSELPSIGSPPRSPSITPHSLASSPRPSIEENWKSSVNPDIFFSEEPHYGDIVHPSLHQGRHIDGPIDCWPLPPHKAIQM